MSGGGQRRLLLLGQGQRNRFPWVRRFGRMATWWACSSGPTHWRPTLAMSRKFVVVPLSFRALAAAISAGLVNDGCGLVGREGAWGMGGVR